MSLIRRPGSGRRPPIGVKPHESVSRAIGLFGWVVLLLVISSACTRAEQEADPSPLDEREPAPVLAVEPVVDLAGDTDTAGSIAGAIAVALSPDASYLVTLQNHIDDAIVLRSFPYDPGKRLTPADGHIVMQLDHPHVHSGGGLVFEPGGDLLVGLGAMRVPDEPMGPQNPDGVVIRVPVRHLEAGSGGFSPSSDSLIARGLRQPWRISLSEAGDLWIGDVGEGRAEEINRVPAALMRGPALNFGWPYVEGASAAPLPVPDGVDLTGPVWWYGRDSDGGDAVIGGYVYRGSAVPELAGSYVFGDVSNGRIEALDLADLDSPPTVVGTIDEGIGPVTSFGEMPDGELLLLAADGDFFQLERGDGASGRTVKLVRLGNLWQGVPPPPGAEATAIASAPDRSLLISERTGSIRRVVLGAGPPELCRLVITELPQLAHEPAQSLETAIPSLLRGLDAVRPELPEWARPREQALRAAYLRAQEIGTTAGWESEGLREMLYLVSVERGEFADAQWGETGLLDLQRHRCP